MSIPRDKNSLIFVLNFKFTTERFDLVPSIIPMAEVFISLWIFFSYQMLWPFPVYRLEPSDIRCSLYPITLFFVRVCYLRICLVVTVYVFDQSNVYIMYYSVISFHFMQFFAKNLSNAVIYVQCM